MNDELFERRLNWMEVRRKAVKTHQWWTQHIYALWQNADNTPEDWGRITNEIDHLRKWLYRNRSSFPLIERHLEQWDLLMEVARERWLEACRVTF